MYQYIYFDDVSLSMIRFRWNRRRSILEPYRHLDVPAQYICKKNPNLRVSHSPIQFREVPSSLEVPSFLKPQISQRSFLYHEIPKSHKTFHFTFLRYRSYAVQKCPKAWTTGRPKFVQQIKYSCKNGNGAPIDQNWTSVGSVSSGSHHKSDRKWMVKPEVELIKRKLYRDRERWERRA